MLRLWDRQHPGRLESIFGALAKTTPSHLLDRKLFDFASLRATGIPGEEGDIGFDVDAPLEQAIERMAAGGAPGVVPIASR